jgi:heptosyltransferase-2
MATGALVAILERWPAAAVDLVVRAGHEALPLPQRGRVIPFDHRTTSAGVFGASLRREGYDRFYVLPPSFSSAWMAYCSRVPERVGYRGHFRGPFLRPALEHREPGRSVHLAREFLDLVDPGLALERYPPRLDVSSAWAAGRLARICRELPERFVALAPGAVYGPAKAWPAERYRDLAAGLRTRAGMPVVLLGTSDEQELAERVRAGVEGILNWCGTSDVPGLVAVLSRAELLVSNDSGAMHVMAAMRRPQVAIFGSTSPAWTGPLNPKAAVIARGLPCSPCFERTCRYGHYDCLRGVTVEQVIERSLALIPGSGASALPPDPAAPAREESGRA